MDSNKKQAESSSSSTVKFDQLFNPKDSSSSSLFGSIFPPPPSVDGRGSRTQEVGSKNHGALGTPSNGISYNKNINSTNYQNEIVEPSYYSSSIYYGGQENYSPRNRTTQPHHVVSAISLILFHIWPLFGLSILSCVPRKHIQTLNCEI